MDLAHSKIGASSCERWWNCPGSVREVARMPPQPDSPYALEGSVAHLVGEFSLLTGRDATEYIGQKVIQIIDKKKNKKLIWKGDPAPKGDWKATGLEWEVTDEMAEAVQVYVSTIRSDMEAFGVHPSDLAIEHRFHLKDIDPDAFGTNDCNIVIFGQKVIVYDYKHGSGVAVDAEDNKQGLFYALGAIQGLEVREAEIVIVQPRAFHSNGSVRRWTVSLDDLETFANLMKGKITETKALDAPLVSGDHCKKTFCAAMATCPAVRKTVEGAAMTVFSEKPVLQFPKPENLTPVMLRRILEAMPMMDQWLRSVEAFAESKANAGEHIEGFKLVRGREGNRKWIGEGVGVDLLNAGFLEDEITESKLISPAKIEKLKKAKEHKDLLASLITRSEGKIILVPEDDPREAVSPSAIQAFSDKLE